MTAAVRCDVLLVGWRPRERLDRWRLRQRRPEIRVLLVEREPTLGGRHTWSFHQTDVEPAQDAWLAPLVRRSWPGNEVRFPGFRRKLRAGYRSIASDGFHRELAMALGPSAWLGRTVRELRADGATLDDGTRIEARCVIDGRGFAPGPGCEPASRGSSASSSLLEQRARARRAAADGRRRAAGRAASASSTCCRGTSGGCWSRRRCYADDAGDRRDARAGRDRGATRAGAAGAIAAVEREERGALPIPLAGDIDALWSALPPGVARAPACARRSSTRRPATRCPMPSASPTRSRRGTSFDGPAVAARAAGPVARVVAPPALPAAAQPHAVRGGRARSARYVVLARFYRLHERTDRALLRGSPDARRPRAAVGRPPARPGRPRAALRSRDDGGTVAPAAAGAGAEATPVTAKAAVIGSGFGGLALAHPPAGGRHRDDAPRAARQAGRARLRLRGRGLHLRRRADRDHGPALPRGAVRARRAGGSRTTSS